MIRLLPKVVAATALVALAPVALAVGLQAAGAVEPGLMTAATSAACSLALYHLGARWWQRRRDSGDVLFCDLMLWGWVRRIRLERRLASAVALVGRANDLSLARRVAALEALAGALEAGDPYTHGHSRRVARYASVIARRMGIRGAELARIRTAAAVHDIGKLSTPRGILHKPGRLTDEEFAVIRRHPTDGAEMVVVLDDEELTAIVRHHHERLDGSGYPDRLRGEQIPLGAAIIAVADTFDAITSARPYREARPHRDAIELLEGEAGTQLDARAVAALRAGYRGRRPVALWLALADGAERLVGWLAGGLAGSAARTVVVAAGAAAGAAALGAGALRASGPAHPNPSRPTAAPRAGTPAAHGAPVMVPTRSFAFLARTAVVSPPRTRGCCAAARIVGRPALGPIAGHGSRRLSLVQGSGGPGPGSPGGPGSGSGGSGSGGGGGPGSGGSGSGGGGSNGGGGGSSGGLVGGGPVPGATGGGSAGIGAQAGANGAGVSARAGGTSARVTASGGSVAAGVAAPGVAGAGATVNTGGGSPSAAVTVNTGAGGQGVTVNAGPLNITLGGSSTSSGTAGPSFP